MITIHELAQSFISYLNATTAHIKDGSYFVSPRRYDCVRSRQRCPFHGKTQATRIAKGILDNVISSCMDLTFKELDDHFKMCSDLTGIQGHIRLRPGIHMDIKAFVQWDLR